MSNPRTRFLLKAFGLWILGALAISIPLCRINLIHFYRLKRSGVRTNGMVTALRASEHQAVYYKYEAAGQTYSGSGRAGFGNPEFCCLAVGQNVIVYYLPSHASESCIGVPDDLVGNEVPPIAGAGIAFPILAIAAYSWRIRSFRRWLLG